MRLLCTLLCLTFLSACTLFPEESLTDREAVRPPPVIGVPDQTDKFYYAPDFDVDVDSTSPEGLPAPVCDLEEIIHETEPETVKSRKIDFLEDTVKISEELDPQEDARSASYLHLSAVEILRVSGSRLDFIQWLRVWMDPIGADKIEVAWGNNEGDGNSINLRVDGSVNVRQYLMEGVLLRGEVRASAPQSDTQIKARLTFLKFSNCL